MDKPKISVIVPVYNVEEYLPRCLNSILDQTFEYYEIIIVSDGPEGDDLICEEYYNKFPKKITQYIKGVAKGLGGARNAGIEVAKGEYLAFIDSDDWIEPDFLEKMYTAITSEADVDIAQCATNVIYESDFDTKLMESDQAYFNISNKGIFTLSNNYYGKINVATWNKLYKRELIQKYNIRFPEKMWNEDAYFTWAYWSVCRKIALIPIKLYNYVRRSDSMMSKTFAKEMGEKVLDHLTVGEMFYDFLEKNNLLQKRKEAFFNAYKICWIFVKHNGSEKYQNIGIEKAQKFLVNKRIPRNHAILKYLKNENSNKLKGRNSLIENIFSIKNDINKTHKVVTILGMKIKLSKRLNKYYGVKGQNNKIIIIENGNERKLGRFERIKGLNITILGDNNTIIIEQPSNFEDASVNLIYSYNSLVHIAKTPDFRWNIKLANGFNQQFIFGENSTTSWKGSVHILDSNAGVEIGKNNMISGGIVIFASDAHTVYETTTKKVLNQIKSHVKIGDNCWIATDARFLKNARVANNSIVASNSLVTREFTEENVIIAGNPAQIIKRNVSWDIRSPEQFIREENVNV